jgi:S-adenosylmethionine synthetase
MRGDFLFTSESVTEGHPDKLCDQISDTIVDHFLMRDRFARIRTECTVSKGMLFIAARFASPAKVDLPEVSRSVIDEVGYTEGDFSAKDCTILTSVAELPPQATPVKDERALSEEELEHFTVGNQATVFGFACRQTPVLMPLPIWLAHRLARRLSTVRLSGALPYLCPDGKTQVGVEYRQGQAQRVHSVTLIASQAEPDLPTQHRLREDLIEHVVQPVFSEEHLRPDERTHIFINPDGPLIIGGPVVHSGLTGRKNAVDTYGEYARHSGNALSGKDPIRVDRVGAYAARYAAKNVVASGLAEECEVQLSYTIGLAQPVSVQVETFGTSKISDGEISRRLRNAFDFRLGSIIRQFNLRSLPSQHVEGFFRRLAAYGQVGREDMRLPWEATDKVEPLR